MRVVLSARMYQPARADDCQASAQAARRPGPPQASDNRAVAPRHAGTLRRLLVMDAVLAGICLAYWRSLGGLSGTDYRYPVSLAMIATSLTLGHLAICGGRAVLQRGGLHQAANSEPVRSGTIARIALVAVLSLLYVVVLPQAGVFAATCVLAIVLGRIAGWRSWPRLCLGSALLSLIAYYVFVRLLLYPVPGLPRFLG